MRRFAILPLGCYFLLIAYACYGAAVVGHWPYYAHPDPKELPGRLLSQVASIVVLIGALSLILLPIGYAVWRGVLRFRHQTLPEHRTGVLLYAAGAAVWMIDFVALRGRAPWHSIVSWILD